MSLPTKDYLVKETSAGVLSDYISTHLGIKYNFLDSELTHESYYLVENVSAGDHTSNWSSWDQWASEGYPLHHCLDNQIFFSYLCSRGLLEPGNYLIVVD